MPAIIRDCRQCGVSVLPHEVGPHRFASREGDVQMVWMPERQADTILLSYPADSRGRLTRSCS